MFKSPISVKEIFFCFERIKYKGEPAWALLVPEVLRHVQLWLGSLEITPSLCLSNYLTKATQMLDDWAALVRQSGRRVCMLIWNPWAPLPAPLLARFKWARVPAPRSCYCSPSNNSRRLRWDKLPHTFRWETETTRQKLWTCGVCGL